MQEKRLGRGLDYLLSLTTKDHPENISEHQQVVQLQIGSIRRNRFQPREKIDPNSLQDLMASIKENGVLQPILVRKEGIDFELIAGERRLQASKAAGMSTVPAIVLDVPDKKLLQLALIENIQREDLNPIEEGRAFKAMLELEDITHEELAKRIGKQRSTITNSLRLLELPFEIQEHVSRGTISQGHARALLGIKSKPGMIKALHEILSKDLSVREVEKLARRYDVAPKPKNPSRSKAKSSNILSHEETLKDVFGTKVEIQSNKDIGFVKLHFYSKEDFLRLYNKLLNNK
jgi:ParB family chromosome partitioning protein